MEKGIKETVKNLCKSYAYGEDGMGTVEIILIIVVLVGLVVIFKSQITSIVNDLFDSITDKTDTITS